MPRHRLPDNPVEAALELLDMSFTFEEGQYLHGWQSEDTGQWNNYNVEVDWEQISDAGLRQIAMELDINPRNRKTNLYKERPSLIRDIHANLFPKGYAHKSYSDVCAARSKRNSLMETLKNKLKG